MWLHETMSLYKLDECDHQEEDHYHFRVGFSLEWCLYAYSFMSARYIWLEAMFFGGVHDPWHSGWVVTGRCRCDGQTVSWPGHVHLEWLSRGRCRQVTWWTGKPRSSSNMTTMRPEKIQCIATASTRSAYIPSPVKLCSLFLIITLLDFNRKKLSSIEDWGHTGRVLGVQGKGLESYRGRLWGDWGEVGRGKEVGVRHPFSIPLIHGNHPHTCKKSKSRWLVSKLRVETDGRTTVECFSELRIRNTPCFQSTFQSF